MKDFFISYNSADCQWAEWIAWQLEEAEYTTVLQAWDFRPGSNFVLEIQRAATEAERTIAVLSPDYLGARFTQPEWAAAFGQDPTGEKGTLVPVRVRECELKGLLPAIIYIDLVGLDEGAAWEELLAGVSRERAKPTAPPRFPAPGRPYFPKALPPIWNIPYRRNPNFTGRESLLAELRSALTSGQPAALIQAIVGLGGIGKTQLAVEYAYRHAAEYDVVWWVRAEEPATLAADYAGLAGELGLPEEDVPEQRVVVAAVRRWLGQNAGWLLVFDNAPGPAEVRDYLPQGATGHVLLTSRNLSWRGIASLLAVQALERTESVDFLLKRTGQGNEGAAAALAEALGDLPLALEQAGTYVEATGKSLAEYLELFGQYQRDRSSRETLRKYDVFLSYSHHDAQWVEALAWRLENEYGIRIWLDRWTLVPGENWQQAIERGLEDATTCAVCIGGKTPEGWFREEIERALDRQVKDKSFRVIPVLLPDASPNLIPRFLSLRTWANFRHDQDQAYALHVLIQGIRGLPVGQFRTPSFPGAKRALDQYVRKLDELHSLERHGVREEVIIEFERRILNQWFERER